MSDSLTPIQPGQSADDWFEAANERVFGTRESRRKGSGLDSEGDTGLPPLVSFYQQMSNPSFPSAFKIQQRYFFYVDIFFGQSSNIYENFFYKETFGNKIINRAQDRDRAFTDDYSQNQKMKLLVQSADLPNLKLNEGPEGFESDYGRFSLPGTGIIIPDSNSFTVKYLSTEYSIHEHLFYEWMKEVSSNEWVYDDRPFTKAIISVVFLDQHLKKEILSYRLHDCFPITLETVNPSHMTEANMVRDITFNFDYVTLETNLTEDTPGKEQSTSILEKIRKAATQIATKARRATSAIDKSTNLIR